MDGTAPDHGDVTEYWLLRGEGAGAAGGGRRDQEQGVDIGDWSRLLNEGRLRSGGHGLLVRTVAVGYIGWIWVERETGRLVGCRRCE
jgi:hypothetical protein